MSDQATRLTEVPEEGGSSVPDLSRFLARHYAALVVLQGPHRGAEYPLRRERIVIGRDRGADLVFEEETLSREHAVIHYRAGAFLLEDLGSANGCRHNGALTLVAELEHGDIIDLGRMSLQVILEDREPDPKTQVLDES